MKILAIETATESCSVALQYGDSVIHRFVHEPQQQANLVLPMIDELMAEAQLKPSQLDMLSFGRGPGSFTGLRIAAAVTQAIAMACDLPVAAVSTLAVLAQTAFRLHGARQVLATVDARMQEVYWAAYACDGNGLQQLQGDEHVSAPDAVTLPAGNWFGVGSGFRAWPEALTNTLTNTRADMEPTVVADCWPQAQDMLALARQQAQCGRLLSAEKVEPVYIRDKVARSLAERGLATQAPSAAAGHRK